MWPHPPSLLACMTGSVFEIQQSALIHLVAHSQQVVPQSPGSSASFSSSIWRPSMIFSFTWLQLYWLSICNSLRRHAVFMCVVANCSCNGVLKEDLCARARLQTCLSLCWRRGRDSDTAPALFALKWKGSTSEEKKDFVRFSWYIDMVYTL